MTRTRKDIRLENRVVAGEKREGEGGCREKERGQSLGAGSNDRGEESEEARGERRGESGRSVSRALWSGLVPLGLNNKVIGGRSAAL